MQVTDPPQPKPKSEPRPTTPRPPDRYRPTGLYTRSNPHGGPAIGMAGKHAGDQDPGKDKPSKDTSRPAPAPKHEKKDK